MRRTSAKNILCKSKLEDKVGYLDYLSSNLNISISYKYVETVKYTDPTLSISSLRNTNDCLENYLSRSGHKFKSNLFLGVMKS